MRIDREEQRRLVQALRLTGLTDEELRQVGRELYWRAEQFGTGTRAVVNDELRRRRMQTVPLGTGGDVDYGGDGG